MNAYLQGWANAAQELATDYDFTESAIQPELPFAESPPRPVAAWIAVDEVIIVLEDDTSIQVPVRRLRNSARFVLMNIPQKVWDIWHTATDEMRAFGFERKEEGRSAELSIQPTMPRPSLMGDD